MTLYRLRNWLLIKLARGSTVVLNAHVKGTLDPPHPHKAVVYRTHISEPDYEFDYTILSMTDPDLSL